MNVTNVQTASPLRPARLIPPVLGVQLTGQDGNRQEGEGRKPRHAHPLIYGRRGLRRTVGSHTLELVA